MSAGALVALTTPTSAPFILRVGGRILTSSAPLSGAEAVRSISITESSDGPSKLTFTIEDTTAALSFLFGEHVELNDRRAGSDRALFGGHLIETVTLQRSSGKGCYHQCTAIGYDTWLDWRIVPNWSSKTTVGKRVTKIASDRAIVQQLIARYGGPLSAPNSTVDSTNTDMPVVRVTGVTLREALSQVAESATKRDDTPTRYFYVDTARRLNWYKNQQGLTAPYRIADGSYTVDVLATSGLVSLWPLREASGTAFYDAMGYANGTSAGTVTANQTGGIANEPALRSLLFNGSTGYVSASGANLHPGDTFSIEFWFRRTATGAISTVWSGGTDDVEVRFDATDHLAVLKEGTGSNFTSDDTYTSTSAWYHVVVAREPGDTDVYVNGSAITGTTTARTFSAGSGTVNIGRQKSGTTAYYGGYLQHVAVYSTKLSAATALAHYRQGISIAPVGMTVTRAAMDGREAVYVKGANKLGTGYVRPGLRGIDITFGTVFGMPGKWPERQEFMDRSDSESLAKLDAYGASFLKRHNDPVVSGTFKVTGYDGWRVGQLLTMTVDALGLDGYTAEIKEIATEVGLGTGTLTHTIDWGERRPSGARAISRRTKRRR